MAQHTERRRKPPTKPLTEPRVGACEDCGCRIEHWAPTGPIPARCSICRPAYYRERNRLHAVEVYRASDKYLGGVDEIEFECVDCGLVGMKSIRATLRVRCVACAKENRKRVAHAWDTANRDDQLEKRRQWRKEHVGLINARKHRRRSGEKVGAEYFDRIEIFRRDGWICQLCGGRVDPDLRYPDRWSASIDHRLAIAKGGKHTRANTQLAHLTCNKRKGVG